MGLFCPGGFPPGHRGLDSRVVSTPHFLVVVMPGAASLSLPARKSNGSTARRILECRDPGSLLVVLPTPHFTGGEARSPVPETSAHWCLPCPLSLQPGAECLVLGQSGRLGLQGPSHTRLAVLPLIFKSEPWVNGQDLSMWGPPGMVRGRLVKTVPRPPISCHGASPVPSLLYRLLKYIMSLSA